MESTHAATPAGAPDTSKLRSLLHQGNFLELLAACDALLADSPGERDALLFGAIARRHLGRPSEALTTLTVLEGLHPRFSRLYEERGRCHVELKDAPRAIEAFHAAVTLNHALPASWSMLASLFRMTGQTENEAVATAQVGRLKKIPTEVVTGTSLFLDGDLDPAESMVRRYLLEHGDEVEAMRLLARIGIARKIFDDPEILLAAALRIAPEYLAARKEYAEVLVEVQKYPQARDELLRLLEKDPANRAYYEGLYAATCVGLGEHERAIELYRALLERTPGDADTHLSIAHAQKTLGRSTEAIESYRKAAQCRPAFGDAYWSLANLKTYKLSDEELERARAALADPAIGNVDRYHLSFALGKGLEDRGEFAESYRHYETGNALKRAESKYRPEIIERNTAQQIEVCSAEFFAARRGWGVPDPDPILIVGLPRSGSTLIEQILASHSKVEGTQELPNVQQIVATLRGRDPDLDQSRYPRILAELTQGHVRELGAQYLAGARIYRTGLPFFIDKMPNNFRHLGLVHLMLPNAKIIDARREPMACCFSNLKQLFAKGQEFTYSAVDIARYYRTYLELMRHWDEVLPARILRVQHEDVVDDLEGNVRRILAFCGLEFEPGCIEFYKTARSVRTASSEQVRRPIYRESVDQWRHYQAWLEPLRGALGDALERYRE
jgi:tetratricopeptide (TPR) repeat protein